MAEPTVLTMDQYLSDYVNIKLIREPLGVLSLDGRLGLIISAEDPYSFAKFERL